MAVDEGVMRHLHKAAGGNAVTEATFLPDPEPRDRKYTLISVDDHLIEPAHVFEGRMPAHLQDDAPKVVTLDGGKETWVYEDGLYPQVGLNAVAGRPKDEWSMEPARFDEMRRGCYDIEARIADMDLDGVWATLCFPSLIAGFAGTIFAKSKNQELGLAALRAWNQWHIEEWAGPHPDRVIPLQLAWVNDPQIAGDDIRRNAELGFKAVSFPENPVDLKLPPMIDKHWDPFLRACEETETVVCLHNGSSSWTAARSPGAPLELYTSLFPVNALVTAADWLWAQIPTRFPNIKIAFSEGGISWVPMLIDRIDYVLDHSAVGSQGWDDPSISPVDALRRNFWFCTIDLGSVFALREHIGIDHICMESDYPHADSTWPDTQLMAADGLADVPADHIRKVTWENASKLFRHPVPEELQIP
jgi:predicted TIM-barrel fold metal-dependent hydrolase